MNRNWESTFRVRAPGRVNLIGEHIDYVGGCVMPMAIEPCITGEAAANDAGDIVVTSDHAPEAYVVRPNEVQVRVEKSWTNYVTGVVEMYRREGIVPQGFRLHLTSTIPAGAGLSSSAALETVVALAVEHFAGVSLDAVRRATLCQQAEHEFPDVPCGIMDQMAVGACRAGHAMLLDCQNLTMRHVAIPKDLIVVVADTGVSHALADGEYAKRRKACEAAAKHLGIGSFRELSVTDLSEVERALSESADPILFRRVRHVLTEMERVGRMAEALEAGDLVEVGRLMAASHDSLRDDYEVSCPDLDQHVEAGRTFGMERGWIGSRMTGGGFGGSTIHLVRRDAAEAFIAHLGSGFITEAVDGAVADVLPT